MDINNKDIATCVKEYSEKLEETKKKIRDAELVLARRDSGSDAIEPSKGYLAQLAKVEKLKKHLANQNKELARLNFELVKEEHRKKTENKPSDITIPDKPEEDPMGKSPPKVKDQVKKKKKRKKTKKAVSGNEAVVSEEKKVTEPTAIDDKIATDKTTQKPIKEPVEKANESEDAGHKIKMPESSVDDSKASIVRENKADAVDETAELPPVHKEERRPVFWILLFLLIALAAFSGYKLISGLYNYKLVKDTYAAISELAVIEEPKASGFPVEKVIDNPVLTVTGGTDDHASAETIYGSLTVPKVDFDGLLAEDENVIGWISLPAIEQGYPIMHYKDNEYYLHKTLGGKDLYAGSIFMDYKNSDTFDDPNTFIYGHNMMNGTMFGSLVKYKKQDVYDSFPAFWVVTKDGTAKLYHIFSVHNVTTETETYKMFTDHGKLLENWALGQQAESVIKTDDVLGKNSKIITLSTCTSDGGPRERLVVQGVLVYETKA